eukprot:144860-Chlamydomonas_euryale.AAC.8
MPSRVNRRPVKVQALFGGGKEVSATATSCGASALPQHTWPRPFATHPVIELQGGGGNPFDMKNLMESVKKAQTMVQAETARVQGELAA